MISVKIAPSSAVVIRLRLPPDVAALDAHALVQLLIPLVVMNPVFGRLLLAQLQFTPANHLPDATVPFQERATFGGLNRLADTRCALGLSADRHRRHQRQRKCANA